jgi:hypothetical protein
MGWLDENFHLPISDEPPLLREVEERAGRRRVGFQEAHLSGSLPARASQGERDEV